RTARRARDRCRRAHSRRSVLLRLGRPCLVAPGSHTGRAFGEARVDILIEGDVVIEYAGFHHQLHDQLEVWAPRRERLVLHPIERIRESPSEQTRILTVVVTPDKIGSVNAMRTGTRAVFEPQTGSGDAIDERLHRGRTAIDH